MADTFSHEVGIPLLSLNIRYIPSIK